MGVHTGVQRWMNGGGIRGERGERGERSGREMVGGRP